MAGKTLSELRTAVGLRYGDPNLAVTTSAEINEFLLEGYQRVCTKCPWLTSDSQSITATVGSLGEITLGEPDVGAVVQVAISKSAGYYPLEEVSMFEFNHPDYDVVTTVEGIEGYALEGSILYLYPILFPALSVTVRVTYQNAAGLGFPTADGTALPATVPKTVDNIIIRYALYELYNRDNDFQAASMALTDFNQRIMELQSIYNRPKLGGPMLPRQSDFYLLDVGNL